jgi:hypothetical protein
MISLTGSARPVMCRSRGNGVEFFPLFSLNRTRSAKLKWYRQKMSVLKIMTTNWSATTKREIP